MNEVQIERLTQLENQAIDAYLDKTDFDITLWLDPKECKEYCQLYNMQYDEKYCRCGLHQEWMEVI